MLRSVWRCTAIRGRKLSEVQELMYSTVYAILIAADVGVVAQEFKNCQHASHELSNCQL